MKIKRKKYSSFHSSKDIINNDDLTSVLIFGTLPVFQVLTIISCDPTPDLAEQILLCPFYRC